MKKFFPFLNWLPNYQKANLSGDISAGLTVGVMLVPQGMAYSMLAGLPPIYGLYASTIPLLIYALLGTSRQLAVGPVAMVSLLIASGIGAFAELESENFIALAVLLALMVGILQFLMGIFRLGFMVNFLSHPVIAGFTSAAAIIIGFSQLKNLLGLDLPRAKVHETIGHVFQEIGNINWITFGIGIGSILLILLLRKINKRIPSPLIVVLLGLALVYFLDLNEMGVKIVEDVPAGLPFFDIPAIDFPLIKQLFPIAITISLISFMESIAVSKAIHAKHKDYELDANQELIGLGLANVVGSFFQAFPTTGGFSRTAVNDQAGAKTGLAAIISASLVIFTLLFLTEYFYFLPKAALAAIIMVAVFGLIDFSEAKHLWQTDKKDFLMFIITAIATLLIGVEEGIIVGVISSIVMLMYNVSFPHMAEIARIPGTMLFRNIDRFKDIQSEDEILIVRFDARLFFSNIAYFKQRLKELENRHQNLEVVILDAEGINGMDSSAIHMLSDVVDDYHRRNIQFLIADLKGPVRDQIKKAHLTEKIGEDNFFLCVDHAVNYFREDHLENNKRYTLQANQ